MFQGNRVTHYWQYFSLWCHNSKHCSDESVYTLNHPTYFIARQRHTRKHYVSQSNIGPADTWTLGHIGTGRWWFRKSVIPDGSGNDRQERNEEKSLGRGHSPTAVGSPAALRTRECQREALAELRSSGLFKSLETLAFLYTANWVNFAF